MKKLIVVMSVMLTAASYGAQIDWGTKLFRAPGMTTQMTTLADTGKAMFYLVYANGGTANFAWASGATWGDDTVLNSAGLNKDGGTLSSISSANNSAYTAASVPASYDAYVVAFYNAAGGASSSSATHYWISSVFATTRPTDWASAAPGDTVTILDLSGKDLFVSGTLYTTNWQTVPEPTSMALLALGVAALGLRRKLSK